MSIECHAFPTGRGSLPYLFAAATDAAPSNPLVVLLHGARDRGDDPQQLLAHGLPRHVAHGGGQAYHFLAPQIPVDTTWADWRGELLQLIDAISAHHPVDPRRIVLAGFSAGSAAVWQLAAAEPDRFAGLVIVAGRVPESVDGAALARLSRTPVWIFHGGRDQSAPAAPIEATVSRLHGLGVAVRFTFYPEADHFISDAAYSDPALQRWLATVPRRYPSPPRVAYGDVDPLFLNRWSPRAMSGEPIDDTLLLRFIEAARWAPSAGNSQPWRFLYVRNGGVLWPETLALLSARNRQWAPQASALILLLSHASPASACGTVRNPSFDSGAAWAHLALQATLSGWHTRAIAGFDRDAARALFQVPAEYELEILIALGRLGDDTALPAPLREREPPSARLPLSALAVEGRFSFPAEPSA